MTIGKGQLVIPEKEINRLCEKWRIKELALFGSVLRDDFLPSSDIDVLVSFNDDAPWGLFDMLDIITELEALFGRDVDLVERDAIRNPFRRREIFTNCQIVYAA